MKNPVSWMIICTMLFLSACEMTDTAGKMPNTATLAPAKPVAKPIPEQASSAVTSSPLPAGSHIKVALLVPLSGENAQLGQAMMDAANLAVFDIADKSFELIPEDTGNGPEQARQAASRAVTGGAKLILGPIFSSSVASVRPVAKQAGLNVISFTTDSAQAGDNVFVMGFLPSTQIERVTQYAKSQGASHFAALVPESAYGNAALSSLQSVTSSTGATITSTARYTLSDADLTPRLQSLSANGGQTYDALFIPEGGDKLLSITKTLPAAGIDTHRIHLIGTGLWDEPSLGSDPNLVGGWYAGTPALARGDFERRFEANYHYKPPRLATLAYDATALSIVLAKSNPGSPAAFDASAITKISGFSGIDGIFRFHNDGLIERGLAVLQIAPGAPIVIDPAPKSFQRQLM